MDRYALYHYILNKFNWRRTQQGYEYWYRWYNYLRDNNISSEFQPDKFGGYWLFGFPIRHSNLPDELKIQLLYDLKTGVQGQIHTTKESCRRILRID